MVISRETFIFALAFIEVVNCVTKVKIRRKYIFTAKNVNPFVSWLRLHPT